MYQKTHSAYFELEHSLFRMFPYDTIAEYCKLMPAQFAYFYSFKIFNTNNNRYFLELNLHTIIYKVPNYILKIQ